jgi:hypothetical protein
MLALPHRVPKHLVVRRNVRLAAEIEDVVELGVTGLRRLVTARDEPHGVADPDRAAHRYEEADCLLVVEQHFIQGAGIGAGQERCFAEGEEAGRPSRCDDDLIRRDDLIDGDVVR